MDQSNNLTHLFIPLFTVMKKILMKVNKNIKIL